MAADNLEALIARALGRLQKGDSSKRREFPTLDKIMCRLEATSQKTMDIGVWGAMERKTGLRSPIALMLRRRTPYHRAAGQGGHMTEIVVFNGQSAPALLNSAVKAVVRNRGVKLATGALDALVTYSTAALMPLVRNAKLAVARQDAETYFMSRFMQMTTHFGQSRNQRLLLCFDFCQSILTIEDRGERAHIMALLVTAYDSDDDKTIRYMQELTQKLVDDGLDKLKSNLLSGATRRRGM